MSNRATKYESLFKSLKKHYKPLPEVNERTVLEHMIYACCLEEARAEQADEAFAKLQQAYFDWNEVRVTTVIELSEALSSLPNPASAGHRIKRCLQSLFEARYQYDIDDLKKANLGKATDEITAWKGVTPFILAYVSQNALGGHAIPADTPTLDSLVAADIITEGEAEKKTLPGVERAIPKNKGIEFASLLHQFAIDFQLNPKAIAVVAVFKDLGVTPKPKPKVVEKPSEKATGKQPASPDKQLKAKADAEPTSTSKTKSSMTAEPVAAKKSDKGKPSESDKLESVTGKTPVAKIDAGKGDSKKPMVVKPGEKKPDKQDLKKPEIKKPETKSSPKKPVEKPLTKKADIKAQPKKAPTAKKTSPPKSSSKIDAGGKPKKVAKPTPSKAKPTPKTTSKVKITKKKPR